MTSRASKLVLAAVLAGSLPAAAAARDCDHDRPLPVAVSPAPWQHPAPIPVHERWDGRGERRWRDGWRERELAAIRAELQALEAQRAEFHARNAWRPGKLRRYDRLYLERRAELERRYGQLARVAWR